MRLVRAFELTDIRPSSVLVGPGAWDPHIVRLLVEIDALEAPRDPRMLNTIIDSTLHLSDAAAAVLSSIYQFYRRQNHGTRSTDGCRMMAMASLELHLGFRARRDEVWTADGYTSPTQHLLPQLEDHLRNCQRVWVQPLPQDVIGRLPSIPALLSDPTELFRPPMGSVELAEKRPDGEVDEMDEDQEKDEALLLSGEVTPPLFEQSISRDDYPDITRPRHPLSLGRSLTPHAPFVAPATASLIDVIAVAKEVFLRSMIAKNGLDSEVAKRYLTAIILQLPEIFSSVKKIQLLLAARYTADPEPIWKYLGLLDRKLEDDGMEDWKKTPAWAYIKISRVSHRELDSLASSPNQFSKARAKIMQKAVSTGSWSDEAARTFAEGHGFGASSSTVAVNQAGLANNTKARLRLEVSLLAELVKQSKVPSTWLHAVQLGHGSSHAPYYGVIDLTTLACDLRTTLWEARLAAECGLFSMIEGPATVNIIALGDQGTHGPNKNPAPMLAALSGSGLTVNPTDNRTLDLLDLTGYRDGDLDEYLDKRRTQSRSSQVITLNSPFHTTLRRDWTVTKYNADQRGLNESMPIQLYCAMMVKKVESGELELRLIDDKRTMLHPWSRFMLASSEPDSSFVPLHKDRELQLVVCPHPFEQGALTMASTRRLRSGRTDYWRQSKAVSVNLEEGEHTYGNIKSFSPDQAAMAALGIVIDAGDNGTPPSLHLPLIPPADGQGWTEILGEWHRAGQVRRLLQWIKLIAEVGFMPDLQLLEGKSAPDYGVWTRVLKGKLVTGKRVEAVLAMWALRYIHEGAL